QARLVREGAETLVRPGLGGLAADEQRAELVAAGQRQLCGFLEGVRLPGPFHALAGAFPAAALAREDQPRARGLDVVAQALERLRADLEAAHLALRRRRDLALLEGAQRLDVLVRRDAGARAHQAALGQLRRVGGRVVVGQEVEHV